MLFQTCMNDFIDIHRYSCLSIDSHSMEKTTMEVNSEIFETLWNCTVDWGSNVISLFYNNDNKLFIHCIQ